jgi:hypothetical protein
MNAFLNHHRSSVRFVYSCFDRILLNVIHKELQRPASIVGFFRQTHPGQVLNPSFFRHISTAYHRWVEEFARQQGIDIVQPPKGVRREEWVEPYYRQLRPWQTCAVILKSRENAKVAISHATTGTPHLEVGPRFVWQYYFYLQDPDFGRLFFRICPYFPFNSWLCLNGHEWLAQRLRAEGIAFEQSKNSFAKCAEPSRLQELADQFGAESILACAHRWLDQLVPFFQQPQHHRPNMDYRLYVSQVEYCTNLVFHSRATLDRLIERLLDVNRAIGRPDKLAIIFGRRISSRTMGRMQTRLVDHHLGHPVLRGEYKSCALKQYVRDRNLLRVEASCYHLPDLGMRKGIEHLPQLRNQLHGSNERWLDVQQDVLETYIDRGHFRELTAPTVTASGRRTPGLKVHDLRLLAVMQALVNFAYLAGTGTFRTLDLLPRVQEALGHMLASYTLSRLRYDLTKLRGKGLVLKIPGSRHYRLTPSGYRICVVYLKLFDKLYGPLTSGLLDPIPADGNLPPKRYSWLDRLYRAVEQALTKLLDHVGIKCAA